MKTKPFSFHRIICITLLLFCVFEATGFIGHAHAKSELSSRQEQHLPEEENDTGECEILVYGQEEYRKISGNF